MKSLYLIDISSFIFRAYYAIRPLSTQDGTPVNAVFGVVSMINKLIDSRKPDHLVVCNDRPDKGFRYEIFPKYKANRDSPPDDLIPQFDLIKEFIQTYPIRAIERKGFEADDIIASLVARYKPDKDLQIFIVSSDKDLMQLVDDNVFLYDTMKDKIFKKEDVREKFGVDPNRVIDVQSLCGDSSDNIPGVAGVGPKTAAKLINEYGNLEAVLENSAHISGKIGKSISDSYEIARLSRQLVTLVSDINLDLDWDELKFSSKNQAGLNDFYKKLNFNKFIVFKALSSDGLKSQSRAKFILIDNATQLSDLANRILSEKPNALAFDTETDQLDPHQANLVGMSLCFEKDQAYYIPVAHKEGINIPLRDLTEILSPVFTHPEIKKVGQNVKFDLNVLSHHGIFVHPISDDTMLASYLCDSTGQHNLDYLAAKFLDYKTLTFSEVVPKGKNFSDVEQNLATQYAAEDAWVTYSLLDPLLNDLKKNRVEDIYNQLEIPLTVVLAKMERHGILVDESFLNDLHKEFSSRLSHLETMIYDLAQEQFNINSPKQLSVILFEKLKLPVIKKTKLGFSTDVDVLTELARDHELPKRLLEFRIISKLKSTYVEQLKDLINPRTGRVHTHFNQTIVATGRLSSTEPNLQNIPIKTEEGKRIRQAFIAPNGFVFLSADYSQIELRLLAAFSKDPCLQEAYQNDLDIHAQTASRILGLNLKDVDESARSIGKTINFGVIYGQSPFGLAKQLGVPVGEAKHFIDGFYSEFSAVKSFKESVLNKAKKEGFVSSYLGRKRFLPDLNSSNKLALQNAERMAFNTIFQGSAADLIKKAMIEIQNRIEKEKLKTKMILQVHDELIFEVPEAEKDHVKTTVTEIMESSFKLAVPLKVSCHFGKNWAEAH